MAKIPTEDLLRNFKYDCFENGSPKGCLKLVQLYGASGNTQDRVNGSKVINYCCQNLKDSKCCIELARIYVQGVVVKQNMKRAEQIFKQECDRGSQNACGLYAMHLFESDQLENAKKVAETHCNKKKSPCGFSCAVLTNLHAINNNSEMALHYGEKACNMKNQEGCRLMRTFYKVGKFVTADPEKVKEYNEKIAEIKTRSSV